MCEPTAIAAASFAVTAGQALLSYQAQGEEAANTRAYQQQQATVANRQYIAEANQLGTRQMQEMDRASSELIRNNLEAARARSKAATQANEAGVQGNSVEAIAQDIYAQQGAIDLATIRNTSQSVQQLQAEKEAAGQRLAGRTTFQPVRDPSLIGLGLGIVGAGASAAGTYYNVKKAQS